MGVREIIIILVTLLLVSTALPPMLADGGVTLGCEATPFEGACGSGFLANEGQFPDEEVLYYTSTPSGGIAFKAGMVLVNLHEVTGSSSDKTSYTVDDLLKDPAMSQVSLTSPQRGCTVAITFEGSGLCYPRGIDPYPGWSNFFIGNDPLMWATGIKTYSRLIYEDLYDGIDLVYRSTQQGLKYEFILAPGADPDAIRIRTEGHSSMNVEDDGVAVVTPVGTVLDEELEVFYRASPESKISSKFVKRGDDGFGFALGPYDDSRTVVIDPLLYCSYYGGGDTEFIFNSELDDDGCLHLVGITMSVDFPTTPGAYNSSISGDWDSFVVKLNANGTSPLFSTYFGGSAYEAISGIDLDAEGNIYLSGITNSTDLPVTSDAIIPDYLGGYWDGFVCKFNSTGQGILYSSYIGTAQYDNLNDLELGSDGSLYVTGRTTSHNLTNTTGTYQSTFSGGTFDGYVMKINRSGRSIDFATYLGGDGDEVGSRILVDDDGFIYISGSTTSTDFPTTASAYDRSLGGQMDGYVTKLAPDGSDLEFSTYVGGSDVEDVSDLALGENKSLYIVGISHSNDFPTTAGVYQRNRVGFYSTYVVHLHPSGTSLEESTLFGRAGSDEWVVGTSMAINEGGNVFIGGYTQSTIFPTTEGAAQRRNGGGTDAFVSMLSPDLARLLYSSYHGGDDYDIPNTVALADDWTLWLAGSTRSGDFPVTPDAYQRTRNGEWRDVFVSRFDLDVGIPIADAGQDLEIEQHETVTFNGTGSRDNVGIVNWTWSFDYEGENREIYGPTHSFTFHAAGVYDVTLMVKDEGGKDDTDSMTVTVLDITPPFSDAGEDIITPQLTKVVFNGTGSTDNMGVAKWEWNITLGEVVEWLYGPFPEYTFEELGRFTVWLNTSDFRGNWDLDSMNVTVMDIYDPVAMITPLSVVDQYETVTLDGSASQDNVGVVNWTWTIVYGQVTVELYGPIVLYRFEGVGDHRVELTVADADGNTHMDFVILTVRDATPPIADAGPDIEVEVWGQVQFDGSRSSDNVGISSWSWTFMYGGEPVELTGRNPKYTFGEVGTYEVTMNITDETGLWSIDVVVVSVMDVSPPLCDAGRDMEVDQHTVVDMEGSGSVDNVGIINWTWTFEYNGVKVNLYGEKVENTFDEAGACSVVLTVTDMGGNNDTDEVIITVRDTTAPHIPDLKDRTVDQGSLVVMDASDATDNVGITSYRWSFQYDGGPVSLTGNSTQHTFGIPGVYQVTLTVSDAEGNSVSTVFTVTVKDTVAPMAIGPGDLTVKRGEEVTFDATGSTDNVGIVKYTWSFKEDGGTVNLEGGQVEHAFDEAGEYEVTLTVEDADGNTATSTFTVTVSSSMWLYVLLALVVIVVIGAVLFMMRRRPTPPQS